MTSAVHRHTEADWALARQAGTLHGHLIAALVPWVRGNAQERQRIGEDALNRLRDSGEVSADEYRTVRRTFDLLAHPATTHRSFLDHLATEQEHARQRPGSPFMTLFLGVGQDSASQRMGPTTAADLIGAVIGIPWGVGGALIGASALSTLEASSTPAE